jgi:DNA (cytosine-5)-methyltransferase 1
VRDLDQPAPTVAFGHNAARVEWVLMPDRRERRPLSVEEAAALQSLPPAYPLSGSRTSQFRQVGNAVPPVLADAVIAAAVGPRAEHLGTDRRLRIAA